MSASPAIAASPHQSTAAAATVKTNTLSEQLKDLPPNAKRVVEEAIDFFGMENSIIHASRINVGEWRVSLDPNPTDSENGGRHPSSVYLVISAQDGKLRQLYATGKMQNRSHILDKSSAVDTAEDFAVRLLGKNVTVANTPFVYDNQMAIPIYPIINEIPLQAVIATVRVDASGSIRAFHTLDTHIDKKSLPSAD